VTPTISAGCIGFALGAFVANMCWLYVMRRKRP
jgi:hypothetical protein